MALSKRHNYSDSEKARVFAELTTNDGNIKRTARNLGMPVSTVRYFKQKWETEGVPKEVSEAIPAIVTEFVEDAERVRDKMLIALEDAVDKGDIKPREMITALGVLTDKIRAMRGLDAKKVEHSISLPDVEEMRELFSGIVGEVVGAAERRANELSEAEIGEWEPANPKALPTATEVQ